MDHLYDRPPIRESEDTVVEDSLQKILGRIQANSTVLDVGCAVGELGRALLGRDSCVVDGLDINPLSVERAKEFYRQALVFDLNTQSVNDAFEQRSYDVIVLADVLEHLQNPVKVLKELQPLLKEDGHLVISIPNATYAGFVWELSRGHFDYRPEGILDETHIRFYTEGTIHQTLREGGFNPQTVDYVQLALQDSEFRNLDFSRLSSHDIKFLNQIPFGSVYQLILEARASTKSPKRSRKSTAAGEVPTIRSALRAQARIYTSAEDGEFSEKSCSRQMWYSLNGEPSTLSFEIPKGTRHLRFDPSDIEGTAEIHAIQFFNDHGDILWAYDPISESRLWCSPLDLTISEPITVADRLTCQFLSRDPRIIFSLPPSLIEQSRRLNIKISWKNLEESADGPHRERQMRQELLQLGTEIGRLSHIAGNSMRDRDHYSRVVEEVKASHSWRITAPVRGLSRFSKNIVAQTLSDEGLFEHNTAAQNLLKLPPVRRLVEYTSNNATVDDSPASAYEASYQQWLSNYGELKNSDISRIRRGIVAMAKHPQISVVMPVYRPDPQHLRATIESVFAQLYDNWDLCICDDASQDDEVRKVLEEYASRDSRVKLSKRDHNSGIVKATNQALGLVSGEVVAFLDHDDLISPEALYLVAREFVEHPEAEIVFTDEDKIDSEGRRFSPYFKADYDPLLLLGQNYFNHLTAMKASLVRRLGGLRDEYLGSQDWDLLLRATEQVERAQIRHIAWPLYHWRVVPSSTASSLGAKPYAVEAGLRAVTDALSRRNIGGVPGLTKATGHVETTFDDSDHGLVSIVIPTKDKVELLKACITSLERTSYPSYEIVVINNQSTEQSTIDYLGDLKSRGVRVLDYDQPFNYAEIHNWVIPFTQGKYVCLMNNDIEVISPGWLSQMVALAELGEVGAVGAQLLYPNNVIQHAGVILGIGGVAGHANKDVPYQSGGYFGGANLIREYSAVTGACLLVSRDKWNLVGGMDQRLRVAFNDVDFCLKLRQAGLRNVYSPLSVLIHHESRSRGSDMEEHRKMEFATENSFMHWKWGEELLHDPYFSPLLSLRSESPIVRESVDCTPWGDGYRATSNVNGYLGSPYERISVAAGGTFSAFITFPFKKDTEIFRLQLPLAPYAEAPNRLMAWIKTTEGTTISTKCRQSSSRNLHGIDIELDETITLNRYTPIQVHFDLREADGRLDLIARFSGKWGEADLRTSNRTIEVIAVQRLERS